MSTDFILTLVIPLNYFVTFSYVVKYIYDIYAKAKVPYFFEDNLKW
jgi:hypothetical protein